MRKWVKPDMAAAAAATAEARGECGEGERNGGMEGTGIWEGERWALDVGRWTLRRKGGPEADAWLDGRAPGRRLVAVWTVPLVAFAGLLAAHSLLHAQAGAGGRFAVQGRAEAA